MFGMLGQNPKRKSAAAPLPPNYLVRQGPFLGLPLVDANTLPNLTASNVVAFAYNFFKTSRTSPLQRNLVDLNGTFAACAPDPSGGFGYSFFTQVDTFNVGPGQGWGGYNGIIYPDGSCFDGDQGTTDGTSYWGGNYLKSGLFSSGGSGGGGGGSDSAGLLGYFGADGSLTGGNGNSGTTQVPGGIGVTDFPGPGGRGTGAADIAGMSWTPGGKGGDDGFTNFSTGPWGSGGFSGTDNEVGVTPAVSSSGGAGGPYIVICARIFGGTGPGTVGLVSFGGNAGADGVIQQESAAGGGGLIEVFVRNTANGGGYDGSIVLFNTGGNGSQGTPAGTGAFFLYELDINDNILNVYTDPSVTF